MASEIQIANLALARIGASATISSLTEASFEAEKCLQFYGIARDNLLARHDWAFATHRVVLSLLGDAEATPNLTLYPGLRNWRFAYATPSDMVTALAVLPAESMQQANPAYDFRDPAYHAALRRYYSIPDRTAEFIIEHSNGAPVLYTGQQSAVLRYTRRVTEAGRFSPLFVDVLAYSLASMIAGPIVKGDAGEALAGRMQAWAEQMLAEAGVADANQQHGQVEHVPSWLAARN